MTDHQKGLREAVSERLKDLLVLSDGQRLPCGDGVCVEVSYALRVYRAEHSSDAPPDLFDMSEALEGRLGRVIHDYLYEHNMAAYCCTNARDTVRMNPRRRELIGRLLAYLEEPA